jgi:hypothetical protein
VEAFSGLPGAKLMKSFGRRVFNQDDGVTE